MTMTITFKYWVFPIFTTWTKTTKMPLPTSRK